MTGLEKIRARFRPEEAITLLFLLPFVVIAIGCDFLPKWNPRIVLIFLAPALIVGLAGGAAQRSGKRLWQILRDFLPLLMAAWVYENLHLATAVVHFSDKHGWLIAADEWLCGGINPLVWLQRTINPYLTNVMVFAYTGHFLYAPLLLMVLYRRNRIKDFRDAMLAIVITMFLGYCGYVLVPAPDPWVTMKGRFSMGLLGSPIAEKAMDLYTISTLRIPRDSFPSLHTALALVILAISWRVWRSYFWFLLPFTAALIFSTVYLRLHYLVDLIAAVPVAIFSVWVAPRVNRWWYDGPAAATYAERGGSPVRGKAGQ